MKKDFKALPERRRLPSADQAAGADRTNRARDRGEGHAVGGDLAGFPILTTRKLRIIPALLLAASYLGQHRMSGGVLYDELREKRGLNYGDYAYIEYFPTGMFLMEPPPNLARQPADFPDLDPTRGAAHREIRAAGWRCSISTSS